MTAGPLDLPTASSPVLGRFLEHFRIERSGDPSKDVARLAGAFARLPYENLTKIVRHAEIGRPTYRLPETVVAEHFQWGAGGTCFSLTATLLHLIRSMGLRAEPILADRPYGLDTHAALIVWLDDRPHLVDPGYLITDPLPLDVVDPRRFRTAFNELILTPTEGDKLGLSTVSHGRTSHRLHFKTTPADPSDFMKAWDASFDWDMMHYPVLTRIDGNRQIYLQDRRLQSRTHDELNKREVSLDELAANISAEFGMDRAIVDKALKVLWSRGDIHG